MKAEKHGANLFELSKHLGANIKDFSDFSSNINPLGISPRAKDFLMKNPDLLSLYPDPSYVELKRAISSYTGSSFDNIILGQGATELTKNYITLLNPRKGLIFEPSYSEYEKNLSDISCQIFKYRLKKEDNFKAHVDELIELINSNEIELFVFANPNNPTGLRLDLAEIEKILNKTRAKLLVDECYQEFSDSLPATRLVDKYPNLFVVRGSSKFFAAPGIRLGYGLSSNELIKKSMENFSYLWSINIVADQVGQIMFKDKSYIDETYKFIKKEKAYFYKELDKIKALKAYKSDSNFILVEILGDFTSYEIREYLLRRLLIVRDCAGFRLGDKFFRFCILTESENRRLIKEIKEFLKVKG